MSGKRGQRGAADSLAAAASQSLTIPVLPLPVGALDSAGLEALGLAQEQARRKESTGSLSSKFWLSLLPQAPRHPFVRSYFPLKVVLVDSKRLPKTGWSLQLLVELLYENGEVVPNQRANVEVYGHDEHRPIIMPPSGTLDLKVRVLTCSMAHEGNKNFFLRFSGVPIDKTIPSYVSILPATSNLMTVIRHQLKITQQPPSVWYKDEQMPTDVMPKVDKFGGVKIRVRVEEVSKNHQKQAFVIKIGADAAFSAENLDISSDISTAVTVLSKRNKRRPKRDGDDDSPEGPQPVHAHAGGIQYQPPLYNLPAASAAAATMPMSFQKPLSAQSGLAQASSSTLPTITPTGAVAKPHAHLPTLAATSLSGANMTRITSADGSSILNDSSEYKAGHQSPTFSDTISHLVNWSVHVNDLLTKIEWQHVGFEVLEDGQMNLHRPLYRCPGCWSYQDTIRQTGHKDSCKISKLSSAYRTHVHVYLQDLLNMATGNSSAGLVPASSTSSANPSQLASANSLMAAYSKNGGGNLYLSQTSSSSPAPPRHNSGFLPSTSILGSAGLQHQTSNSLGGGGLQHQTSLNLSGLPRNASQIATKQEPNAAAAADSSDEPASKKQKLADDAAAQQQQRTNSLFPPAGDWQNLAAMEPLQSPNPLMDRGLSTLGVGVLGDRGMSVLAMGDVVGHTAFATLGAYQDSMGGLGLGGDLNDLPPDSLSLLRAGSSINIEALMADSRGDEAAVDAIHVTATPFGFPAFSASSGSTGPELLGMYQYDESTTFLAFVSLSKFPSITSAQAREMERIYRQMCDEAGPTSRILTRHQCITLEKLKEEALLLHYASQASGFLSADTY